MSESNPLKGLRILNTRPQNSGQTLSKAIEEAGGKSISIPALEIINNPLKSPLPDLKKIDIAIFTSPNAVHFFMEQWNSLRLKWAPSIQVITIGSGTAKALLDYNIETTYQPETPDSEHLIALPVLQNINNTPILLIKGQGGREVIANELKKRGALLFTLDVYKRVLPKIDKDIINSLWRNDEVDIILFTSQQAIANLFLLFGSDANTWLCSKPCLVISERLARAAASYGIKKTLIASHENMIESIAYYYNQGLLNGNSENR